MISMFTGAENAEEEEQSESDVEMETQSERMRRYLSSEMWRFQIQKSGWCTTTESVTTKIREVESIHRIQF